MKKNVIAVRREDLDKRGEQRVALTPEQARTITGAAHTLLVQPRKNPVTGEIKRAFPDKEFENAGAQITEDIGEADLIFGLKEVKIDHILPERTYLMFSHTHKGQTKNRKLLSALIEKKATLIDFELITNKQGDRLVTAFTYFAGYAGMIDSLWAFGQRMKIAGVDHPFNNIPQSIEIGDLNLIKGMVIAAGELISEQGTPPELPPFVTVVLGTGKTSLGATDIYDLLPVREIALKDLETVFAEGDRHFVYKLVLEIDQMFRLKPNAEISEAVYRLWPTTEKIDLYFKNPQFFESNLDQILPWTTVLMNCILWSPEFPRTLSKKLMEELWLSSPSLQVIGDITCDPNGSIEFSQETWIDEPVFIYDPITRLSVSGMEGNGVAVMAVTNLPCEFSVDASRQFSQDLSPLLHDLIVADYSAEEVDGSGLPKSIAGATILWKGRLTADFGYMEEFLI